MKKLQELSVQELQDLYDKNNGFACEVDERVMQINYEQQQEEFDLLGAKVFDYHDHYNSFYLTLPRDRAGFCDVFEVAHKLDRDYMTESTAKIYDKFNELVDKWGEIEGDDEELEKEMETVGGSLAEAITNDLRCYEQMDKYDIENYLQAIADGLYDMSEWETDGTTVTQTIIKEYK